MAIFNGAELSHCKKAMGAYADSLDIYYMPEFLSCDAVTQGGEAEIFIIHDDGDTFIYPYIKLGFGKLAHKVPQLARAYDISSPYGYCGPFVSNLAKLPKFEEAWLSYARSSHFVSEFVRYHPFCSSFFTSHMTNIPNRNIVALPLNDSWSRIWEIQFSATNRNLIRKMEKEGYACHFSQSDEDFEEFIQLYYSTMEAVSAQEFYFFSRSFFHQMRTHLKQDLRLAKVTKDGQTFCSSLFLIHGKFVTYYLSGRNLEFSKVPATNFMLKFMAQWAHENGYQIFNLGGGKSGSEDDSLFKFKRNFSKDLAEFTIGRRILSDSLYYSVIEEFVAERGERAYEAAKHIVHFYRFDSWLADKSG